jgi:hypothetical protein
MTFKQAQQLAIKKADSCWPHYDLELTNEI